MRPNDGEPRALRCPDDGRRAAGRRLLAVGLAAATLAGCAPTLAVTSSANSNLGSGSSGGVTTTTAVSAAALVDRRVFVEGDSLTVGVSPYLPALLIADGWDATIDAQIGRLTATGISILQSLTSAIGGTLVVGLGTNDYPDPTVYAAHIDEVMEIAAGRKVIWVSVARRGWDRMDETLIAAQYRWANLHVIDWRPIIAAHPDMRASDGIHLTDAGYFLRAEVIAAAVERAD